MTTGQHPSAPAPRIYSLPRPDWLALHDEEAIDPARPIVDPHHHLWDRPGEPYLADAAIADMTSGHNIVASVYVECHSMYRPDGPEAMRPVGEVEFAARVATLAQQDGDGSPALCAGIVGHADLMLGDDVRAVLEAEIAAGGGHFRGIRHSTAHDADPVVGSIYPVRPQELMAETAFRRGFAHLAHLGLSFDSWLFHPQMDELLDLARAFPETTIVLNHCGGPIGVGRYADDRAAVFRDWKAAIGRIAAAPNVHMKLGGLAIRLLGRLYEKRPVPPSSEELASAWRPYMDSCIDMLGPDRCMFESNFPPDKGQCSYRTLFNAFKRIAASYGEAEKTALFSATAGRVYRLELD
ncbi:amidohydrolase [Sphingobium amiense]|uniref:Amidohydrolase n=1 Tax=Sphingobium amiense TaxID=135719 RepID=A0A494W729_9SPHN|nr:amidohydrolase family protein [Sphingobium amiense]BBD98397.1 amidohydrolase [Sphingobium amiense]